MKSPRAFEVVGRPQHVLASGSCILRGWGSRTTGRNEPCCPRLRCEEGAPVSPAFAARWLLPRIERFHTAWPDTDVRLDMQLKAVDFQAQRIDIGVRYAAGEWPGLIAEKLMDEDIFPVCSPNLKNTSDCLSTLAELANQTLIHDLSIDESAGFTT